jgi:hypothetical protein
MQTGACVSSKSMTVLLSRRPVVNTHFLAVGLKASRPMAEYLREQSFASVASILATSSSLIRMSLFPMVGQVVCGYGVERLATAMHAINDNAGAWEQDGLSMYSTNVQPGYKTSCMLSLQAVQ